MITSGLPCALPPTVLMIRFIHTADSVAASLATCRLMSSILCRAFGALEQERRPLIREQSNPPDKLSQRLLK
jgi:hypothetical protein